MSAMGGKDPWQVRIIKIDQMETFLPIFSFFQFPLISWTIYLAINWAQKTPEIRS